MTANLAPHEAQAILDLYAGATQAFQTAADRAFGQLREMVQLQAAPQPVQQRPSDLFTVQTFIWGSGQPFRVQSIGGSADRLRVTFIVGGSPTPIVFAAESFTVDDIELAVHLNTQNTGRFGFLPVPPVTFDGSGNPIFCSVPFTIETRAQIFFAPPSGDFINDEDVELTVLQEFASPQGGPVGGHRPGCSC